MKAMSLTSFSEWKNISGFDAGPPPNFLLELYEAEKMEMKTHVTSKDLIFEVSHIDHGTAIKFYFYAENEKKKHVTEP